MNIVKTDQIRIRSMVRAPVSQDSRSGENLSEGKRMSDTSEVRTMVTVSADTYVHAVCLEGGCQFEDNYFSLMPGESGTIACWGEAGTITGQGFSM